MRRLEAKSIDRKQWLAALHVKDSADAMESVMDDMLTQEMEQAERLLLNYAHPKGIYKVMDRMNVHTEGLSIKKHLEGCHQVILMAVTLGADVDTLLRKMQVSDMALAVIVDAGASVMIEQICDSFEEKLKKEFADASLGEERVIPIFFTSRFSPGYGDYPVHEQKRVLQYLEAQKKIGLNVTRDSLMIPRKSVTALIGAADHPVTGKMASCNECVLKEKCTLRKEGKFCGDRL